MQTMNNLKIFLDKTSNMRYYICKKLSPFPLQYKRFVTKHKYKQTKGDSLWKKHRSTEHPPAFFVF